MVAAQAAAVLLRVEGLRKEIGDSDILVDINFEIHRNEILGLIGPNGAGKTTLLECLAGLRPRTAGTSGEHPPKNRPTSHRSQAPRPDSPTGGGDVYTSRYLASLIGGTRVAAEVFASLRFNDKNQAYNQSIRFLFSPGGIPGSSFSPL